MEMQQEDALETLREIARSQSADLMEGDWNDEGFLRREGLSKIGRPPGSAALCSQGGSYVVLYQDLSSPESIEQVLHELAHISTMNEWKCYELEAVWALRLGPEVATAVARMAQNESPHEY